MQTTIQFTLANMLLVVSLAAYSQTPWELDKEDDGIRVYTRTEKGSDFKAFKAVTLVDATNQEILEILKDADNYTRWYGYTKSSKLLNRTQDVQYNYVETTFPWPFKNRDMVYRMSIDTSNALESRISLSGLPDYLPEQKGIVRMKKAEGYILLRPKDHQTEIVYIFHSEPGENIPVWLANSSIAELPLETLKGLKEILNKTN